MRLLKTYKKHLIFSSLIISSIGGFFAFKNANADEVTRFSTDGKVLSKWYTPPTPTQMSFAGEKVPLNDWEIKKRLDREVLFNYYMHGSTMYIMKLAATTMPTIERILKEEGVPDDFKYLAVAESALYNQISKAGAVGYWQFLKATGTQFGLEISDEVDERYDLEKSTRAACKYLIAAKNKLGSWTAAAASYNCGMGGYNNHATFQGSMNYYDLLLPEETNRYVFRILAFKYLLGNANQLGYMVGLDDTYKPVKQKRIRVTESIPNLATFAAEQGTNYKKLKIMNQWLRDRKLSVSKGKSYELIIPLE